MNAALRGFFAALLLTAAFASPAFAAPGSAPFFETGLLDLDGKPTTLASYRGKPLVVNFWARLCYPCRTEIPELVEVQKQHEKQELAIVAVAVEDQPESIRDFAKAYGFDLPIVLGRDAAIALMQGNGNQIAGIPYTVAIDRNGAVVYTKAGALKSEDIQTMLEKVLR